jgi:hypothetical protein
MSEVNKRGRSHIHDAIAILSRSQRPEFDALMDIDVPERTTVLPDGHTEIVPLSQFHEQCWLVNARRTVLAALGGITDEAALIAAATELCRSKPSPNESLKLIRRFKRESKADRLKLESPTEVAIERCRAANCEESEQLISAVLEVFQNATPIYVFVAGIPDAIPSSKPAEVKLAVRVIEEVGLIERSKRVDALAGANPNLETPAFALLSVYGAWHLRLELLDDPVFREPKSIPGDPPWSEYNPPFGKREGFALSEKPDTRFINMRWVRAFDWSDRRSKKRPIWSERVVQCRSDDRPTEAIGDGDDIQGCGHRGGSTRGSILNQIIRFDDELARYKKEPRFRRHPTPGSPEVDTAPHPYRIIETLLNDGRREHYPWPPKLLDGKCGLCRGRRLELGEGCLACGRSGIDHMLDRVSNPRPKPRKKGTGECLRIFPCTV